MAKPTLGTLLDLTLNLPPSRCLDTPANTLGELLAIQKALALKLEKDKAQKNGFQIITEDIASVEHATATLGADAQLSQPPTQRLPNSPSRLVNAFAGALNHEAKWKKQTRQP